MPGSNNAFNVNKSILSVGITDPLGISVNRETIDDER